jgi:hypothetical protein
VGRHGCVLRIRTAGHGVRHAIARLDERDAGADGLDAACAFIPQEDWLQDQSSHKANKAPSAARDHVIYADSDEENHSAQCAREGTAAGAVGMWKTRLAFSKGGGKGGKAGFAFPRFPRTVISTALRWLGRGGGFAFLGGTAEPVAVTAGFDDVRLIGDAANFYYYYNLCRNT